jgi:hypothetical protein
MKDEMTCKEMFWKAFILFYLMCAMCGWWRNFVFPDIVASIPSKKDVEEMSKAIELMNAHLASIEYNTAPIR